MSFDMNNVSGMPPAQLPRRPLAQQSADSSLLADLSAGARGGIGDSSSSNQKSLLQQYGHSVAMWGSREIIANALNRVTDPMTAAGKTVDKALKKISVNRGKPPSPDAKAPPSTYSDLFHLKREQVPLEKLSTSSLVETVKGNVQPFKEAIQSNKIGDFFKGVTAKSYVKDTVIDRNIRPIKDLMTNSSDRKVGAGLAQGAAFGLIGYDVAKHTSAAYQHAKAQEDGTFKSKLNTYKETAVALGKYTFRDGASWEVAGAGAAVGRALIPVALGGVTLGGIAVGAAAGLAAQKALNHVLKTGEHDPIAQDKK